MADIFVSYTRADQKLVRRVMALLTAQGWSVWWDKRMNAGERWDEVIEREIKASRCVVVVWTPRSISREWVHLEAHHGRSRGILVPLLIGVAKPPFAFSLIQARDLSGWDGTSQTTAVSQFLADVRQKLKGGVAAHMAPQPQPQMAPMGGEAEREWRSLSLDASDDPGLLAAFAAKWERADPVWSYKAKQRAAALEGRQARRAEHAAAARYRAEGRFKVDANIVHGAPDGWFTPGAGNAEWFKDLDAGPEMVVVPAGSFTMGSSPSEIAALKQEYGSDWPDNEGPQRAVRVRAPFAVGRFPVTFAEWDASGLRYKPDDKGWGRGRRPVINVSWEDAQAYVRWLAQRTSRRYRLLSEAEWEYCCRAGTTTRFAFGDSITHYQAQFSGREWGDAEQTAEAGRFPSNAWGLHEMHGNVWEWCQDNWHKNYQGAPQDASVWAGGDASRRVVRGGSWGYSSRLLRSAARFWNHPSNRYGNSGFRLARAL